MSNWLDFSVHMILIFCIAVANARITRLERGQSKNED